MYMGMPFLTSSELAHRWRLTPKTLDKWRCAGKSPPYEKIGSRILYKMDEIEEFERNALRYHTSQVESPISYSTKVEKQEIKMTKKL